MSHPAGAGIPPYYRARAGVDGKYARRGRPCGLMSCSPTS